jgi:hypothetical protein
MDKQTNKERVREWLKRRRSNPAPLPEINQIRRELGWALAEKVSEDRSTAG